MTTNLPKPEEESPTPRLTSIKETTTAPAYKEEKTNPMTSNLFFISALLMLGSIVYLYPGFQHIVSGRNSLTGNTPGCELAFLAMSTSLLLIGISTSLALLQKKIIFAVVLLPILLGFSFLFTPMLQNYLAWQTAPHQNLLIEQRIQNATPNQAAAGHTYLELLKNQVDSHTFFQKALPLTQEETWAFTADDPTLYNISGEPGKPNTTAAKYQYCLPLSETKSKTLALLTEVPSDIAAGHKDTASQKILLVLAISNRLADHPQLVNTLFATYFLSKAAETLQKYPELAKDPLIQKELQRATDLPQKVDVALQEDIKTIDRAIEDDAKTPNGFTQIAFLLPPQATAPLRPFSKHMLESMPKMQQLEKATLFQGQVGQSKLVRYNTGGVSDPIAVAKDTVEKLRAFLN
jgi:hypothetical protein